MLRATLAILLVAAALLVSDLITVVRVDACPDEHLPALIGMPFVQRTSIPWVNSMSGVLYVKGLLMNWLVWAMTVAVLHKGIQCFLPSELRRSMATRVVLGSVLVLCGFVVLVFFTGIEWHVQWAPDIPFQCPTWKWSSGNVHR